MCTHYNRSDKAIQMGTHNIPYVTENRKDIPIMPLDLALLLTFTGSNYPCLELIFMVPKVFEPLKFYSIFVKILCIMDRRSKVQNKLYHCHY